VHQPHHPGLALDQSTDRRAVVVADDEIAPMPGLRPVDSRERPVVDGEHWLLKPRPPALLALMGSAVITTGA
jgi:hypothetical protein